VVGFVLCCSSCCVIVGLGYAVCYIGFRCHKIRVMLTGVDGDAEVERGMQCMVAVMVVCI
jgi:hypothetical protein